MYIHVPTFVSSSITKKIWDVYLLFVFLFYDVELKVDSIGQLVWGLASDMAGRGGFACTPETNVAPENGGFPIGISVSRGLFSGATVGGKNYSNPYIHPQPPPPRISMLLVPSKHSCEWTK